MQQRSGATADAFGDASEGDARVLEIRALPREATAERARRRRVVVAALLLGLALPALFLLSPPPQEEVCGRWIDLGARAGLLLNCDTHSFVRLADRPGRLLEAGEIRQTRPVYVLAASGFLHAVRSGARALGVRLDDALRFGLAVAALNLLNLVLLGASLAVLADLLVRHGASLPWVLLGVIGLATSDLVKVFVWTPHTQMLNLLAPVAGLWMLDRIARRPEAARWGRWSFGAGVASLAYATFATLVAALAVLRFVELRRRGAERRAAAGHAALLVAVGAVPVCLWIGFVQLWSGSFTAHEITTYREGVWVADAAREGGLAGEMLDRLGFFVRKVRRATLAPFFALGLVGLLVAVRRKATLPPIVRHALLLFGLTAAFVYLVGVYPPRLLMPLTPPLLVIGVLPLCQAGFRLEGRRELTLVAPAVLAWVAFQVGKSGPFE